MEKIPKITQLPKPDKEDIFTPENYDDVALELKEKMVMSFLRSTALSPQNFVLQQAAALEPIIDAREMGLDPEVLFTQLTVKEKEAIGLRLEYARDKLHVAHDVASKDNPATSYDIFSKLFNAHTVGSALSLERSVKNFGINNEELRAVSLLIQRLFYEQKNRFTVFRVNASGNDAQKQSAELWLQNFVREVRDEVMTSDAGRSISERITPSSFYNVINILLPSAVYLG